MEVTTSLIFVVELDLIQPQQLTQPLVMSAESRQFVLKPFPAILNGQE